MITAANKNIGLVRSALPTDMNVEPNVLTPSPNILKAPLIPEKPVTNLPSTTGVKVFNKPSAPILALSKSRFIIESFNKPKEPVNLSTGVPSNVLVLSCISPILSRVSASFADAALEAVDNLSKFAPDVSPISA